MMSMPIPRSSDELGRNAKITSMLFLDAVQVAAYKKHPAAILMILSNVNEYSLELQTILDLQMELGNSPKSNSDYAYCIGALK
jgi:hypothetical protein